MSRNLFEFHELFWNKSLLVLSQIERRGITLDLPYLERKCALALETVAEIDRQLNNWAADYIRQIESSEVNWSSATQVAEFFYTFKNFPIPAVIGTMSAAKRNTKRKPSTSQASIDWLAKHTKNDTSRKYLQLFQKRNRARTLSSYVRSWIDKCSPDGRVRTSYNPATDTGRLTSSNINLQNIPSRNDPFDLRRGFIAAKGKVLIVADYSQLEMYVMAHFLLYLFGDDSLASMLSSGDVHTNTAFKIWAKELSALGATPENIKDVAKSFRNNAKTVNYAMPYGKTAAGLGMQITDENGLAIGKAAAQQIIDDYFEALPGMDRLFEHFRTEARELGYVRTLLGRNRPLPKMHSSDIWEVRAAERQAVNSPIQGSAADIVTQAMMRCSDLPAQLILQVHDELVFEVDACIAEEQCAIIKERMENPFQRPLAVQLKVDAGIATTWSEGKA